ncbi:MAG: RNA-binding protein [Blautia sp.]|nr:RNA-binding protein [Blautia sp.]
MIEVGVRRQLTVVKLVPIGVYLGEDRSASEAERVLLPKKEVPENTKVGDTLEAFVYLDSSDRPIATLREPVFTLGEVALLTVKEVTRIGAFLDWGLEKDLLLPYAEQTKRVKKGEEVLVALYLDKSHRLCATMKVYPYLSKRSPYGMGDEVSGRVYELSKNFGVFVAVEDKYSALIPSAEAQGSYEVGEVLHLRITQVKEDGKLTVSARKKAYMQMDEDAALVFSLIENNKGVLPFDDKASPELISEQTGLSKNAFKRAVGRLLKEEKISLEDGKIKKKA